MIIDTSALVAIAAREAGHEELISVIEASAHTEMSSVTHLELLVVLGSKRFAISDRGVTELLRGLDIRVVGFTPAHAQVAAQAYARFGKGNHSARLNMGDCASYATARISGDSLLYVGKDFAQTDIASAVV